MMIIASGAASSTPRASSDETDCMGPSALQVAKLCNRHLGYLNGR
jgi:hypothetical protein